jgi:predicted secreted protein
MRLPAAATLATIGIALSAITGAAAADNQPPTMPVITVSAAATTSVPNDKMYAWLRAEFDHVDPARAAAEVNTRMAKALARARGSKGIVAETSGYSSYQIAEKGQPARWRVTQTLALEGADFAAMAALVSKLQGDDQLVLAGMNFAVSPEARNKAEDALTQQALKAWQARAQNAANGFGIGGWRAGRVTIQTGDFARPQPMMRAGAAGMQAASAPVSVEGGNSDVTVTVTGEAVLDPARTLAR